MSSYNWECPHCARMVTIVASMRSNANHVLGIQNFDGPQILNTRFVVCPNPECSRATLTAELRAAEPLGHGYRATTLVQSWTLKPDSHARVFPDFVPKQIRDDYVEACKIRNLSPKASATLSRRCLQGIIRDFWQVKPRRLVDEIDDIKDKVDSVTWDAITAVRKLGNIGAHMEKDVNEIVDVVPEEAQLLIHLIETVITEWYVGKHEREKRMKALSAVAAEKTA